MNNNFDFAALDNITEEDVDSLSESQLQEILSALPPLFVVSRVTETIMPMFAVLKFDIDLPALIAEAEAVGGGDDDEAEAARNTLPLLVAYQAVIDAFDNLSGTEEA